MCFAVLNLRRLAFDKSSKLFLKAKIYFHAGSGLAGFGQSGKNRPFWTGLNRPVQNLSIVQNCPKLSKTLKKAVFH